MTVTINFSPETEKKLQELAARSGKDVPAYIQDLVEKKVREVSNGGASPPAHSPNDCVASE
jgi:predicted DNA-binding protein